MTLFRNFFRFGPLLLCLCSTLAPAQRSTVPLAGGWRFHSGASPTASAVSFDDSAWTQVSIPHVLPFVTIDGRKSVYRGEAWYRKAFLAPTAWKHQRVFLRFEAVSLVSQVFLNGTPLGEHRGGFAAFTYELTGKLRYGAPNQLSVRVDNRLNEDVSPLETSLLYGGIYRNVSLIVTAPTDITLLDYSSPGVFLTQTEVSAASARVEIKTEVDNGAPALQNSTVRIRVLNATGATIASSEASGAVAPGTVVPLVQSIGIQNPHLWNGVADPYLYSVRIELLQHRRIVDTITQPLGLRSFHVDPKRGFVLNGVAREIHGVCLHQDWGDLGWAVGPAQEQQDLDILRDMGVDGLRLVHYQHSQSALDLYDRTGMLVWSELAQFGRVSPSKAYARNVQQQLVEMIRQNYNHPSIVMWSLYNELNSRTKDIALPILKDLNHVAHAEDLSRPTVAAASADTIANAHEIVATQDLIGDNNYVGWYLLSPQDMGLEIEKWNAAYGGRGLALSEYGGGAKIGDHKQGLLNGDVKPNGAFQPEEWQAAVHEGNYGAIHAHHEVWGAFPWLAFDSGGVPRDDGNFDGGNIKGLVTQNREVRKDAYFFYQANWSSKPMVYITSRRDTQRTQASTPVKIYSNASAVSLTVNGKPYGTLIPDNLHIVQWQNITLIPGENSIDVSTPEGLHDHATWDYVTAIGTATHEPASAN